MDPGGLWSPAESRCIPGPWLDSEPAIGQGSTRNSNQLLFASPQVLAGLSQHLVSPTPSLRIGDQHLREVGALFLVIDAIVATKRSKDFGQFAEFGRLEIEPHHARVHHHDPDAIVGGQRSA